MPDRRTVSESLEHWATETPNAPAIVCGNDSLTWHELETMSRAVAGWLMDNGVERGDRVGLHLRKSIELAVAVHAVFRAGACFVPIDPSSPASRVVAIAEDCDLQAFVTDPSGIAKLSEHDTDELAVLLVGEPSEAGIAWSDVLDQAPVSLPKVDIDDLAYIMYTSGSTGPPKGMMHSHRSSLGFAEWGVTMCGLGPQDRVANFSPLHFDISVFDYFSSTLAGATLVLIPEPVLAFPTSTITMLESHAVTVAFTVPFALARMADANLIDERRLGGLRWILFGGEPFHPGRLAKLMRLLPQARFANVYGPAEAPACVVYEVLDPPASDEPIPIGMLAPHTEALVLRPGSTKPVKSGASGELVIASRSITLGYWNRPELNDRTTLESRDRRWFRTGDIVRRQPDGTFHFLGRQDRMVKTRGYRVELDEIEAALASHPGIAEAAAFASTYDGVTLVHAALVAQDRPLTDTAVYDHLRQRLPQYALPADLTWQDDFPRTTSDKIDRVALTQAALETRR